ncbi:hypothetical protein PENTCL1PPCAC_3622, partial [Pristionchus entomophagus]
TVKEYYSRKGNHVIEIGESITSIFLRGRRRPFGQADSSLLKQNVDLLSQPALVHSGIQMPFENAVQSNEEPSLSTRPHMRVAMPRRYSFSTLYENCEKELIPASDDKFNDEEEIVNYELLVKDIAFKNHEVTPYAYCCKVDASIEERFACSLELLSNHCSNHENVHNKCCDSSIDRKQSIDYSKMLLADRIHCKREF